MVRLALFLLLLAGRAWSCPCSAPDPSDTVAPVITDGWLLGADSRSARLQAAAHSGYYEQLLLRMERRSNAWISGGIFPVNRLRAEGRNTSGIGNPMGFLERSFAIGRPLTPALGAQVEIPIGDSTQGLADSRAAILPYGSLTAPIGPVFASANLGIRQAVGGSNHFHITPHAQTEVLWRATAGLATLKYRPQVYLDAAHPVSEADRAYLTAGAQASLPLGNVRRLIGLVEGPISKAKRQQWRVGLGVRAYFGAGDSATAASAPAPL